MVLEEWGILNQMERTGLGNSEPDGRLSVCRDEPPGCILRGPHWRLPHGAYRADIVCRAGEPRYRPLVVLGAEVVADNREQLAWRDFTAAELEGETARIDFAVSPQLSGDHGEGALFDLRLFHAGNAAIEISSIALRRYTGTSSQHSARQWRPLLGWNVPLSGMTIDEHGFLSIPRDAPTGMFHGLPPLALPTGRYRLSFNCRRSAGWGAWRPLLSVEIVAGDLRQQAYFYAARLPSGRGQLYFDIPPEAGMERGAGAPVEIRFHHFGRTSLAIGAIELELQQGLAAEPLVGQKASLRFNRGLPFLQRGEVLAAAPLRPTRTGTRKSAIIVGNCHAALVHQGFQGIPVLQKYFAATHQDIFLPRRFHEQAKRDLAACDLLVVQDIIDWEEYPLRPWISERCEIVKFPCVRFASLWPFDQRNFLPDPVALAAPNSHFSGSYSAFDGLLARLRKEVDDTARRFEAYRSLRIPGIPDCRRVHNFEERRLLAMDRRFSCRIGEFILERFREEQIFYTTDHPNGRIFGMMLECILKILGLAGGTQLAALDELRNVQVPVHPKVAEALGVAWVTPDRTYRFRHEDLTWEQYVRRYIACYG